MISNLNQLDGQLGAKKRSDFCLMDVMSVMVSMKMALSFYLLLLYSSIVSTSFHSSVSNYDEWL